MRMRGVIGLNEQQPQRKKQMGLKGWRRRRCRDEYMKLAEDRESNELEGGMEDDR